MVRLLRDAHDDGGHVVALGGVTPEAANGGKGSKAGAPLPDSGDGYQALAGCEDLLRLLSSESSQCGNGGQILRSWAGLAAFPVVNGEARHANELSKRVCGQA